MSWKNYFNTSVGKKIQMSLTGLFLITFLLVHCYINAQIFYPETGQERFLEAAHFMGTNIVIRIMEVGLFAFLILHTVQGLVITFNNRAKRKQRYAVKSKTPNTKWYSRSMGLLGSLILIFLVIHIAAFWAPNRANQVLTGDELNLYTMMRDEFQNIWIVIIYILGCVSLAWHLMHGFFSAFQTLGLATNKYSGLINIVGVAFSIIIPLIFIMMPVAFYLQWIN